MLHHRTTYLLAAVLTAALVGAAWSSGLETIELDGYRASFDPDQTFLELEGDLDCSRLGGRASVRVRETAGRLGEADYLVYQPDDWNGDLVLFAHGILPAFVPAGFWFPLPLGFGTEYADMPFVQARDASLCHGFAWAASAFERHGMAVEEGMRDTHLLGAVAGRHLVNAPTRTYVTGLEVPGGVSALALAETYPHRYAGAIVVDTPIGGMLLGFDQVRHIVSVFDVLFPDLVEFEPERGMMPGEFEAFVGALMARIEADPSVLRRMATIHHPGSERYDPDGIGNTLLWPNPSAPDEATRFMTAGSNLAMMMWVALVLGEDALERGGGAYAGDNQHTVYRGEGWSPEDEADLNARVPRHEGDPMAIRYWTFHYEPSGALQVPLVTIRSPWGHVPAHFWTYADRVNRSGANDLYSDWPLARQDQLVIHQNMATALLGLAEWVETGARPTWPSAP